MKDEDVWNWAVRLSVVGLFVIALGTALRLLEHIAVPLVLAWVIATVLFPVVNCLVRIRIPRSLASAAIVALLLIVIVAILVILTVPLSYWLSRANELGQLLKDQLALIQPPLDMLEELGRAINPAPDGDEPPVFVNAPKSNMISSMLDALTPVVDELLIFIIALVFNLIFQREIQDGLVTFIKDPVAKALTHNMLLDIERNMSSYFGTVTIVNMFVGVVAAGIAALLGFPHPVLWGVFAAVLNYIPYLGPLLVLGAFVVGIVVFPTLNEAFSRPFFFSPSTRLRGR